MPRLPDYTNLGRVQAGAGRAIASADTTAVSEATARLGGAIAQTGQSYAGAVQQANDKQARIDYAYGKADYALQVSALQQELRGDPDYATHAQRFAEAEKQIREKTLGGIKDPLYARMFETDAAEYSQRGLFAVQDAASEKSKEYGKASLLENLNKLAKTAAIPQPQKMSEINIQTAEDAINVGIDAGYLSPVEAVRLRQSFAEQYAIDYYGAMPPERALSLLKGGQTQGGFDTAVDVVLKHEGGYNASDGNTGSPVNFGINQKSNPDIDVKSLTEEQAKAIYKERYWDEYDLDGVPAEVQAVVFDGVVNHRSAFARSLVDAAKQGVPRAQLIEMRQAEYDRLTANEKYAPYRGAWDKRLDTFRTEDTQGNLVNFLPADKRVSLIRKAQSESLPKLEISVKNAISAASNGVPANLPPKQAFFELYESPEEGAAAYDTAKNLFEAAQAVFGYKALPQNAIQEDINQSRPAAGDPAFAEKQRLYENRLEAAQRVIRQRQEEPAEAVLEADDVARRVFDNAVSGGEAGSFESYAILARGTANKLGISADKIVPKSYLSDLKKRFYGERGEPSVDAILEEKLKWGKDWNLVQRELLADKDIGGVALVVADLANTSPDVARYYAQVAKVPEAVLKQSIAAEDLSTIKKSTSANMVDFVNSLSASGMPQDAKIAAATVDAARLRAMQLVSVGKTPNEATEQAMKELVTDRFDFNENDSGTQYRIPRGFGLEPSQVRAATTMAVKSIPADILPNINAAGTEIPNTELKRIILERGEWLTSPDNSSLWLYVNGSAVLRDDGRQISMKFADVPKYAKKYKAEAESVVQMRGRATQPETGN